MDMWNIFPFMLVINTKSFCKGNVNTAGKAFDDVNGQPLKYSGAQKGRNDFVSNFTNKVVSSFLGTTVFQVWHNLELSNNGM